LAVERALERGLTLANFPRKPGVRRIEKFDWELGGLATTMAMFYWLPRNLHVITLAAHS
jgi:hypothetical protein